MMAPRPPAALVATGMPATMPTITVLAVLLLATRSLEITVAVTTAARMGKDRDANTQVCYLTEYQTH